MPVPILSCSNAMTPDPHEFNSGTLREQFSGKDYVISPRQGAQQG